jgi:hypothetical protein
VDAKIINFSGLFMYSIIKMSKGSNTNTGTVSLNSLTTGNNNTCDGYASLYSLTTGSNNTAQGFNSLVFLTTGNSNTSFGYLSGSGYTTSESSNISIGFNVTGTAGESNVLRIGAGTGTGNGQINSTNISGIRGVTTPTNNAIAVLIDGNGFLGTVSSSERVKENIVDLPPNNIMKLRPRQFNYKIHSPSEIQSGLIAEEVLNIEPRLVVLDAQGKPESVKYHDLPVLLLAEIQRLERRISDLEKNQK